MRTTNGVVMVFGANKWLIRACVMLFCCKAYGQLRSQLNMPTQLRTTENVPPMLAGNMRLFGKEFLPYKEETNTMRVVTVKFKITRKGLLDTLFISPNAPVAFATLIKAYFAGLNGQWKPQLTRGKPDWVSKWVITNLYMAGPVRGDRNSCPNQEYMAFMAAFHREKNLFTCSYAQADSWRVSSEECNTRYIEGQDYFLYIPFYGITYR